MTDPLLSELQAVTAALPDIRKAYGIMSRIFRSCLQHIDDGTHVTFSGDFARVDYLLREKGAPRTLVRDVHDTRVRLRKRSELKDEELQHSWRHDLKHLCQLIAYLHHCDIPQQLADLFPTQETAKRTTQTLLGECLRATVERWDDHNLYAWIDDSDEPTKIRYHNKAYPYDWSYLKQLLQKGSQLNLVRPRIDEATLYPELIIYEPDLLVNISTVARCFTSYADSPYVDLIRRLEPQHTTEAILLGNLAGQLLDEAIHLPAGEGNYADCAKTFFRDNAISLLTTDLSDHFHDDARLQRQNIATAIHETLPKAVGQFDPHNGIVEPSFYSEMLGLQGRMDYLQLDFKVLLEQKSGKGAFPQGDYQTPRQTEEHYIQLLLYMALIRYNFRQQYEQNNRHLQAFLLYSKYRNSLLGVSFAPELIFKAIKMRNLLAWSELQYAKPDGYRILEKLTPDALNQKGATGALWERFIAPRIASVLNPIHQASPLEQAYYFRFLAFIANEHLLSKLGSSEKEGSGFASTWLDSLEEKLQAGNIHDRLTLLSPTPHTTGRITSVELGFADDASNDMSNFRPGDIVILYPYQPGHEPDARRTMVHRCTIESIATDRIRLTLRAPQTDSRVFARQTDKPWAIEHDFMEASFSPLYRGMHAFLSAPQERRDLVLLQREPRIDPTRRLKGDYNDFNPLALRVKQARDIFLIIGPPGTGKTSFGMLNTVKEELCEPDSNVLLLSYTNRAVDEICSKLMAVQIDFLRLGSANGCSHTYRPHLFSTRASQCDNLAALKTMIKKTRVFVGTTTAFNSHIALFGMKQFSLAVIDEASQILEPQLMGLLSAHNDGSPSIRKFVFIGDHKQLPAVVQQRAETSRVDDPLLNAIGLTDCRLSLFERLLKRYHDNPNVTFMLQRQGRMHPDIAQFPNEAFYKHRLTPVPLPHQTATLPAKGNGKNALDDLLRTRRIAFFDTECPQHSPSEKINLIEAEMIATTVVNIYEIEKDCGFNIDRTVGVIVPYRNQIATIRTAIDRHGIAPLHDITIDTVERYQGSQRKYILYGFTVQKPYQLNFLADNVFADPTDGTIVDRKLNVAMTRAEEHLIIFGNAALLSSNHTFARLLDFMRTHQALYSVRKEDFVNGHFGLQ